MFLLRIFRLRAISNTKPPKCTTKSVKDSTVNTSKQEASSFITIEDIRKANADFIEERSKGLRPAIRYVFSESEINNAWRTTHSKL